MTAMGLEMRSSALTMDICEKTVDSMEFSYMSSETFGTEIQHATKNCSVVIFPLKTMRFLQNWLSSKFRRNELTITNSCDKKESKTGSLHSYVPCFSSHSKQ